METVDNCHILHGYSLCTNCSFKHRVHVRIIHINVYTLVDLQSLLISASDQEQSSESNERVPPPASHEASAEVREAGGQTGSWLLPGQGGRQVGGATLSVQLYRPQCQVLDRGWPATHKTGREEGKGYIHVHVTLYMCMHTQVYTIIMYVHVHV